MHFYTYGCLQCDSYKFCIATVAAGAALRLCLHNSFLDIEREHFKYNEVTILLFFAQKPFLKAPTLFERKFILE